jgi:hypothetical protein
VAQEWNSTSLPWQDTAMPWKNTAQPWNNTDLPWKAAPADILLSATTVAENTAQGTDIGTLSVTGVTGTPTFSLTGTAGGLAQLNVDGVTIERGARASADHDHGDERCRGARRG